MRRIVLPGGDTFGHLENAVISKILPVVMMVLVVGCGGKKEPNRGTVSPTDPQNVASADADDLSDGADATGMSPFEKYSDHLNRVESFAKYLIATDFMVNGERTWAIDWSTYAHPLRTLEKTEDGATVRAGYQIHTNMCPEGLRFWVTTDIPEDDTDSVFINTCPPINVIVPELQPDISKAMTQAARYAWKPVPKDEYIPSFESDVFSFESPEGIYYVHVFVNQQADGKGNVTDAFGGVRGCFVPHFLGKATPIEIKSMLSR